MTETIFARSSGAGRTAIAVWRLSGPKAKDVLTALTGSCPSARRASYRQVRDGEGGLIDDGIVLWFPGPGTATGEDLAEFHLHGSVAVAARFIEVVTSLGLRPADPGEFTLRALRNGRIGLLEAEGLGDLLDSETEQQRQQALISFTGASHEVVSEWREGLLEALAVLEAAVDFPDEEAVPEAIAERALPALQRVHFSITAELARSGQGRRLREGLSIAIIGPPNAGKSTLLNRLLGEERAIVSDIPGTTRDIVSARLEIEGRLVEILDTAGLRETTEDPIECAGMAKSRAAREQADIIIEVDGPESGSSDSPDLHPEKVLRLINKIDQGATVPEGHLGLSALTGEGWDAFLEELGQMVRETASPALFTHERQIALLQASQARLTEVLGDPENDPELLSEDVRAVVSLLDQVTGRISVEDVLGAIFSRFCIGK